ncbi:hypothetical protein CPB84DRAFT_1848085 [Gymnopilus junonius]|uniref:Uncharacterized protein n=1 Tax=Gymnopilus junonius TaxID=109634 RepID=A0A9P5TLA4_GYMJU|nr:hypothetical protein CPB84DRAFT_1848085 [Gymnopilus junonius]
MTSRSSAKNLCSSTIVKKENGGIVLRRCSSNSPGAPTYAAILSGARPSPPPVDNTVVPSLLAEAPPVKLLPVVPKNPIEGIDATPPVSAEAEPQTPPKKWKGVHRARHALSPSEVSDIDMSAADASDVRRTSGRKGRKTAKRQRHARSIDEYEEDSFVEKDDSDADEVRHAYRHAHHVPSQAPRYHKLTDPSSSPSPWKARVRQGADKRQLPSSHPRIPSGVKSSPVRTRGSHGMLNITPKKQCCSRRIETPSPQCPSPAPSTLSTDLTPLHILDMLRDILIKKGPTKSDAPLDSSPSNLLTKLSVSISISPLKIGGLEPSPEIPSPEDPKVKMRCHALFEKVLMSVEPRTNPNLPLAMFHEEEPWKGKLDSDNSDAESLPQTPVKKRHGKPSRHLRGKTQKDRKRWDISSDWHISSDWDSLSDEELPWEDEIVFAPGIHQSPPEYCPNPNAGPSTLLNVASNSSATSSVNPPVTDTVSKTVPSAEMPASDPPPVNVPAANLPPKMEPASNPPATDASAVSEAHSAEPPAAVSAESNPSNPPNATSSDPPQEKKDIKMSPSDPWFVDFQSIHSCYVNSLPKVCRVTNQSLWDPMLAADYPNLLPLDYAALVTWKNVEGGGLVAFLVWKEQTPTIDYEMLTTAVRFSKYEQFVNPSRDSPFNVFVYNSTGEGSNDKGILYAKLAPKAAGDSPEQPNDEGEETKDMEQPVEEPGLPDDGRARDHTYHSRTKEEILHRSWMAICLSTILVVESKVTTPCTDKLWNKFIRGQLHTQEFKRMGVYMCMAFRHEVLVAQIDADQSLTFGTMGVQESKEKQSGQSKTKETAATKLKAAALTSSAEAAGSSAKGKGGNPYRAKNIVWKTQPSTHHKYSRTLTKMVLSRTDTILVYNAIGSNFCFTDGNIVDFDKLPRYLEEIPLGSCTVVGWTASLYRNSHGQLCLTMNIQFVIILATD